MGGDKTWDDRANAPSDKPEAPAATTTSDPEYHNDDTTMGPHEESDSDSGVWSTND